MAETIDDEYIVEQFNRGDESVFDRIVEQHSSDIAALANRLLGWSGEIEDVTQDIFLAAFLGLKKFRCECSIKTWLFTITVNKCRSYRYRHVLRRRLISQAADVAVAISEDTVDNRPMENETFERIRRAVQSLPVKYREPVVLKYLQELPTEQISRILGISKNTLQVRLNRARARLKDKLADLTTKKDEL
ncbi:MAG: RNA polymerase sigma factor [Sedimentisphaerales bacterium]|nr:RNA polymerase sigma factor [Sedimentisphaerales bacterium]